MSEYDRKLINSGIVACMNDRMNRTTVSIVYLSHETDGRTIDRGKHIPLNKGENSYSVNYGNETTHLQLEKYSYIVDNRLSIIHYL